MYIESRTLAGARLNVWYEAPAAGVGPDGALFTRITPGFAHGGTAQVLGAYHAR